ncbi:hypothetical protein BLSMQ_0482 [Brevibacterium aurantiacum]|uniref:Uncharacterized protein n=1 Tax=Brevibacterium aurantiacum TaxID=273384 RepID=A0A1D7W0H8_BREAU|nr:hypothetical protein BLSMQ_0482 [Brevibacterium aurantiacum]
MSGNHQTLIHSRSETCVPFSIRLDAVLDEAVDGRGMHSEYAHA